MPAWPCFVPRYLLTYINRQLAGHAGMYDVRKVGTLLYISVGRVQNKVASSLPVSATLYETKLHIILVRSGPILPYNTRLRSFGNH